MQKTALVSARFIHRLVVRLNVIVQQFWVDSIPKHLVC